MAVTGTHGFGTGMGVGSTPGMTTGVPTSMVTGYAQGGSVIRPPPLPRLPHLLKAPLPHMPKAPPVKPSRNGGGGGVSVKVKGAGSPKSGGSAGGSKGAKSGGSSKPAKSSTPKPSKDSTPKPLKASKPSADSQDDSQDNGQGSSSDGQGRSPGLAPPSDQSYAQPDQPYAASTSDQDTPPSPPDDSSPPDSSQASLQDGSQDTLNPTGYARGGMVGKRRKRRRRSRGEPRGYQAGGAVTPAAGGLMTPGAFKNLPTPPAGTGSTSTGSTPSAFTSTPNQGSFGAYSAPGQGSFGAPSTFSSMPMQSSGYGPNPEWGAAPAAQQTGYGPPPGAGIYSSPTSSAMTGLPYMNYFQEGGPVDPEMAPAAMLSSLRGGQRDTVDPYDPLNDIGNITSGYARGGMVKGWQDGGEVEDDSDETTPDYSQPAVPAPGTPDYAPGGSDYSPVASDYPPDQGDSWWSAPQRVLQRMHDAIFSPAEAAEAPDRSRATTTSDGSQDQGAQQPPLTADSSFGDLASAAARKLGGGVQRALDVPGAVRRGVQAIPGAVESAAGAVTGPIRRGLESYLGVQHPPAQTQEEWQQLPDKSPYRMLAGANAPSRDYMENNLNNIMQANPGMSLHEAVHKFVADPEVSGQPDLAEQHMQGVRGMQMERLAIGRVEYDNAVRTNNPDMMDTALKRLSEAHDYVPDGKRATYTRDPASGDILASVDGGQPIRFSPQQFKTFKDGPGMQFDHLMVNGVENHLDLGSNHGRPAGEVAQGGQQAAQTTGYGAQQSPADQLRNMTPASRAALSRAQIVMGLKPGTTEGLPGATGYAAGQAQAPSAADFNEGKRLGLTDREAQLRAEIMQTRASGQGGPVNWNEIAPTGGPQPPRLTGPAAQQYAQFGGGATTGDPNRISSQYFNTDEKNRVWSTIPGAVDASGRPTAPSQNPAQTLEQALHGQQGPAPAAQAQAPWRPVYGRGTAPVPPPAGDRSLEATAARLYPGTSQAAQRELFAQKGMGAQAAGAEKERLAIIKAQETAKAKAATAGSIAGMPTNQIREGYEKAVTAVQKARDAGTKPEDIAPLLEDQKMWRDELQYRNTQRAPARTPAVPGMGGATMPPAQALPPGAMAGGRWGTDPTGRRIYQQPDGRIFQAPP